MQMPTLSCSLPSGTTEYRKTLLATNSTPHEEMGFPWVPPPLTKKPLQSKKASALLLAQSRSVIFFLNLPTGPLLPLAPALRLLQARSTGTSGKLDVLALFDCHQPTVHDKRLQRDQIDLPQVVKRHHRVQLGQASPTSEGLLDLVCQLGSGIHTQEARKTIYHSPVVYGNLGARPVTSISTHWVTDSACFGKGTQLLASARFPRTVALGRSFQTDLFMRSAPLSPP